MPMLKNHGRHYNKSFRVFCKDHHDIDHQDRDQEFLVQRLMGQEGLTRDQANDRLARKKLDLRACPWIHA
jgi:hypothetical protein